jgi:hypothetical protein
MLRSAVCCSLFAVTLAAVSPAPGLRAQEKEPKTSALTVIYANRYSPYVTVELYRDGKLLRSSELADYSSSNDKVTFENLAAGRYEVHFEGAGYKKFIKRVALAADDKTAKVHVELDKAAERVVGGGPSLAELEKRIAELEKANAELKAEVERLKKK